MRKIFEEIFFHLQAGSVEAESLTVPTETKNILSGHFYLNVCLHTKCDRALRTTKLCVNSDVFIHTDLTTGNL